MHLIIPLFFPYACMVWYFIEHGGTLPVPKLQSELFFKTYQVELGRIPGPFLS